MADQASSNADIRLFQQALSQDLQERLVAAIKALLVYSTP